MRFVESGYDGADRISGIPTARPGVAGKIEQLLSTRFLKRVYRQELQKLDALVRSPESASR